MPYVELQKMLDEANAWGFHSYDKGCYVEELSDGVIDALTEHFPKKQSPLSLVLFYRLDGAYSRAAEDATAFSGGRSPRFGVFVIGVCPVAEMLPAERGWVRSMAEALRPYAASDGSYVNGSAEFDDWTSCGPPTAPRSSRGWSSSRRRTTRATCSTATPTSRPRPAEVA